VRSNLSFINVYKKQSIKSKIVTQLLYGETFKKLKKVGSWIKIKNDTDSYKGYIKFKKFLPNQKNTHKVFNLSAKLYSKPNSKYKMKTKLSFGSKIKVLKKKGKYYKFDNLWIDKKNLKKINITSKNLFDNINKFRNIKYKWGGKHFSGVDCSGLVQLCLNYNNKFFPRDTKDQVKYLRKKIKLKNIRKSDLIFWKGHVAVAISKSKLIHAYGPFKKVVIMSINKAINKIYRTAKLEVTAIKRIN
tara:strand:+ start:261 stop:995 length:735 start_codon:yes stop_codon:yes gene_type:complete